MSGYKLLLGKTKDENVDDGSLEKIEPAPPDPPVKNDNKGRNMLKMAGKTHQEKA